MTAKSFYHVHVVPERIRYYCGVWKEGTRMFYPMSWLVWSPDQTINFMVPSVSLTSRLRLTSATSCMVPSKNYYEIFLEKVTPTADNFENINPGNSENVGIKAGSISRICKIFIA